MAFQTLNFQPMTYEQQNPFVSAFQNALYGPQHQQLAIEKEKLANALAQINLKYAEPKSKAEINNLATLAAFRMSPAGLERGLSPLGKSYVEPRLLAGMMSGTNLNSNGQYGATQPMQMPYSMEDISGSMAPRDDDPSSMNAPVGAPIAQPQGMQNNPNQPQPTSSDISDAYAASRQKLTSDQQTRQKALNAQNVEKTLSRMDPTIMKKYSGIAGQGQLAKDFAQSLYGKPSEDYVKFQVFAHTQAPILAGQIRQFYGESVQPSMRKELEDLANPAYWTKNPVVAMAQFEELIKILRTESDTYNKALNAPIRNENQEEKLGNRKSTSSTTNANTNATTEGTEKTLNGQNFVFHNGSWHYK